MLRSRATLVAFVLSFATLTYPLAGFARTASFNPTPATLVPLEKKKQSRVTCPAAAQNEPTTKLDQLATLGRRAQINPFVPLQRFTTYGAIAGNVSTARGHLAFATTNLDLPGATPLMFQRTYTKSELTTLGHRADVWTLFENVSNKHRRCARSIARRRAPGDGCGYVPQP